MGIRTINQFLQDNREYLRWRLRNPLRSYADFYVTQVTARLDSGASHITLGKSRRDAEVFEKTGVALLTFLKKHGLQPHHVCVDYGCGSLRAGRHLMAYLEPGHYWGFDVTDRFFNDGINDLEQAFVDERNPNLRVISNQTIAELRNRKPDYIFSTGVLLHVPVPEMKSFFKRIFKMMGRETQAFIHFREGAMFEQTGKLTWSYPPDLLINLIRRRGIEVELLEIGKFKDAVTEPLKPGEYRPRYLKITRGR